MKLVLFLFLLFPIVVFGQNNYSFASKKAFKSAESLMIQGELDKSLIIFKEVVKEEPKFSEAFLNMSKIEFSKENFKNALSFGKKALENNNVEHSIYSQVGKSFFMLKDFDSSSYYLQMANLYGANTANDYYLLSKSENNQKQFTKALKNIEKAIEKDNSNSDYYVVRGNSHFGEQDFERAKLDFEKALVLNPNQANLYANLAGVNIETNDLDAALLNINKGMENSSGDQKLSFLLLKGNYFKQIDELDNAEIAFNDAYSLDNKNTAVLINQSAIMIKKGDYINAVEKCSIAIDLDGALPEAYFNRGIAYEMLKKTNEACSDWEEAFIMGSIKAEEFINSPTCNE